MLCKSDYILLDHIKRSVQAVLCAAAYRLQLPLPTAGLALPSLEEEEEGSCKISLHFCGPVSKLSLVPAVHVMRSCCNHNVASIITTNFRQNPNDGQLGRGSGLLGC